MRRSDRTLPGSRSPLREAPIRCGGTLTTRSPAADERLLEPARDVPAVLKRPHALLMQQPPKAAECAD